MHVTAEAMGPKSGRELLAAGADEVLMPCINEFDEAVGRAAGVHGCVSVHAPANRVGEPHSAVQLLQRHGLSRVLAVSGNPGQGGSAHGVDEVIACFNEAGLFVSVGAYPEDFFTRTSAAHREKSARILRDKQAAGAQRIMTQASFSARNMRKWLETVRAHEVTIPIHVGVMEQVPRKVLNSVLRSARSEVFTEWSLQSVNKPNLDLIFRMLRSRLPDPEKFIHKVADSDAMGPDDGFHIFSYGADVSHLIEAVHRRGGEQRDRADGAADN